MCEGKRSRMGIWGMKSRLELGRGGAVGPWKGRERPGEWRKTNRNIRGRGVTGDWGKERWGDWEDKGQDWRGKVAGEGWKKKRI